MICVSIGRSRHKHMLAEQAHLMEQGAELVELRLDYISSRVNIQRLLKDRPCPTVVTVRREQDGGKYTGSEEARMIMLREAIANGVEYVDLEEDIAGNIPRFGKTKRIVSYHSFRNTPDNLRELHDRLKSLDADIVKIATMANQPHDNLRVLEMMQESNSPTIGMCMGDIGIASRILGAKFGAPFTYATFHHERALAPGQLSYDQMANVYRHNSIGPDTIVYGVIADPVGHSLSPQIHNAAFGAAGINAVYVPFRVPFDTLGQFIEDVPRLGIHGLSVTIPHKEAVAKYLTKVTPAVKGIGAVNTMLFKDGETVGCNTDVQAAMDCLENMLGGAGAPEASPLKDKRALVLGAGGVARAVMYGLQRRGAKTTIASRTRSRAQYLAETFGGHCIDWQARHIPTDIIVNCTPVGMHPNVDETPFNKSQLKSSILVFDTVYNPESTLLLKEARAHGCRVVSGVEMFIRQAALQFHLFTGKEAPEQLMRETLKRAIGPVKY
ncbi:MAG TPA: shikimate dehydrogenase [Lacipirellulaceae bacterium]|nr:shikimate dehydrogenase [Lacipirellulaceae bacterium]